jgi:hypothetical protein
MRIICILFIPLIFTLSYAEPQFIEVSESAGVQSAMQGRGVCIVDINNDNLDDIFVCNHSGNDKLYLNNNNFQFTDISDESGIASSGSSQVAVAADYDADGFVDIFVGVSNNLAKLFRNNGNNTFTETSTDVGLIYTGNILGAAWGDYNNDGWLDLYIANFNNTNYLFENNNGIFTDVTFEVGAQGPMSDLCMQAIFLDYDEDGDLEIIGTQDGYRGNYLLTMQPNNMYSDIASMVGIEADDILQGMGVMAGDYNRDGLFDLYFTNLHENILFRQNENGMFTDVSEESGAQDEPMSMAWGSSFFDADNDGWLDIFSNNESGFGGVPTSFFHNQGDGTFSDIAINSGLYLWNSGYGCAIADFENDGDIDMVAVGYDVENGVLLFENQSPQKNWLQLRLSGNPPNRFAIGSVITLWTDGEQQKHVLQAGTGFCSQDSYTIGFGLNELTSVDSLVVRWPSDQITYFPMEINTLISINEDQICIPYGEINGDLSIDVLDIVAVVAYILDSLSFNELQYCQADLNQDDSVDVLDVVFIVSEIL